MKKSTLLIVRKSIIILTIIALYSSMAYSQEPRWKWARSAGEAEVQHSVTDSLGNTIVLGKFETASMMFGSIEVTGITGIESNNLYLVKYNSVGRVLWAVSFYGSDPYTALKPVKLAVNQRGEILVMGTSSNTPDLHIGDATLTFSSINQDVFTAKFYKTGRLLWARAAQTEGSGGPSSTGTDAAIDNQGSIYVTGYFAASTITFGTQTLMGDSTDSKLFLVKYAPNGIVEWAKTNQSGPLGIANTYGRFIAIHDDNIYLTGNYNGNKSVIFGSDTLNLWMGDNIFLAKFTSIGNFEWVNSYGNDLNDVPDKLQTDNDGNIYLTGAFNSTEIDFEGMPALNSGANYDIFITKLDPEGNPLWVNSINSQLISLKVWYGNNTKTNIDNENNFYVVAEYMGASVLYNSFLRDNAEEGTRDIIIIKVDGNSGDVIWAQPGNSQGENVFNSVVFDKESSIYLTGNVNVDPLIYKDIDASNAIVTDTVGNGGFYIIKIDASGAIKYARAKVNALDNVMTGVNLSVDPFGNLYLTGTFAGTGTNLDNIPVSSPTDAGIYTAKFSYVTDISGHVLDEAGSPVTTGYVKLYGFTWFQRSPLSDSVRIAGDGTYLFTDIPLGRYIIFAKPRIADYPFSAQTYYPSALYWEDAEPILVTSALPLTGRDIIVNSLQERTGTAFMGGEIYEADTTSVFKSSESLLKKVIKEVDVILAGGRLKSDYEVIAVTQTDENGDFAFYNIDDGDYSIIADIPGLPHEEMYYVTVSGGEFISNLDYLVGEEYLTRGQGGYTGVAGKDIKPDDNLKVMPNPNSGCFYICLENISTDTPVSVEIFNSAGQFVYEYVISNPSSANLLDIENISAGVYILKTAVNGKLYEKKLIIR
jgi:hypothetical protein